MVRDRARLKVDGGRGSVARGISIVPGAFPVRSVPFDGSELRMGGRLCLLGLREDEMPACMLERRTGG